LPQTIRSNFIGDFKLGDNIAYNLDVLATLYEQRNLVPAGKKKHFNKPIILLSASVIEAAMYDFLYRIKHFTREGVASLSARVIDHFREKKLEKFELYIIHFKKQALFDDAAYDIYGKLDELRKLRNRIHIQNEKRELERDDPAAFTNARLKLTEQCLEFTLRSLCDDHSRGDPHVAGHVADFTLPIDEHFEKGKAPHSPTTLVPK